MVKSNLTSGCFFELLATALPLRFTSAYAAQQFVYNTVADTYTNKRSGSHPTARDNFAKRFFSKDGTGGMQFDDLDVVAKALNCTFVVCATKVPKQNSRGTNTKYFTIGSSSDRIYMKWIYNHHYQLVTPVHDSSSSTDDEIQPIIKNPISNRDLALKHLKTRRQMIFTNKAALINSIKLPTSQTSTDDEISLLKRAHNSETGEIDILQTTPLIRQPRDYQKPSVVIESKTFNSAVTTKPEIFIPTLVVEKKPLIRNQTHPATMVNGKPEVNHDEFKRAVLTTPSAFVNKKTLQSLTPLPRTTPPISEDEEEIVAAVNLVREHLLKDFFPGLDTHVKVAVATSISASIVSVSANISALIGGKLGPVNKAVQIASIVTSLTSFTSNVSLALRINEIKFNLDKVINSIPGLASILHSTYKANSAAWIYPTISALVSLIIGGLTIFNVKDIKEIIQAGSLLKTINTFGSEAKNITKYVLEDLLELDITGDHIQHKALIDMAKRSAELCVLPHYKFFGDPGLLQELKQLSEKATDLTAKKFANPKTSQVARITSQTLMCNVNQLQEKELAIRTVFDASARQETFGVLLAGAPSIGKSFLLTQIWAKLAPIFGYKSDLYNLTISRSDGFFEPYGMQDCGFVNEFMGSREDAFLTHLNSTISADPKNLEGAFQKSQPAQFKLVFLTSNDVAPELTRHLTDSAAKAVWNRILRIQVEDPQCQGRQGINLHRKSDFSHLTIKKVMETEALSKEKTLSSLATITLDSLIVEIAHQIARREKTYLTSIVNNDLFTNEQEDIRKRLARLDTIMSTTNWANAQGGNSYNIIRLQGPLETGKTQLAKEIASTITSVYYKRELVIITQPSQFLEKPSKHPMIYLLDDVIDEDTHNDYFKWINSCNGESLFIITSNTSYTRTLTTKEWIKTKALNCFGFTGAQDHYYVDTKHTHSGIARRLGLYGRVDAIKEQGIETVVNDPSMQMTVDATPGFQYTINGTPISPEDLKQHVFRTYTAFIAKSHNIQILNSTYSNPTQEYDVKITADDIDSLYNAFASTANVTSLLFFGSKGANVQISKRVMVTIPRDMHDATSLIPNKRLETRDDIISLAKRLGAFMAKLIPDIKIYFHLKGQTPIVLINKQLFIGAHETLTIEITRSSDAFHWVFQGRANRLRDEDFALFTSTGILPPTMQELPQFIIAAIVAKYTSMRQEETPLIRTWIDHYTVKRMIQDYKDRGLLSFIFEHKALSICSGILGIVTLTALGTKLYKLLSPVNEANSFDDEDDPESSHYKDITHLKNGYRSALVKGDRNAMVNIHKQAEREGLSQLLHKWEHVYRSNSFLSRPKSEIEIMIRESVNNQDLDSLSFFIKFDPETVKTVLSNKANMLSVRETQHQMPTLPQIWIEKLKRNYVLAINPITHAKVYALGLRDKTAITVSHIFHKVGEQCTIQSDGKQYRATCTAIHRPRDMAIIQIEDKTFPSFRDITNALVSHQDFSKFSTAWYVRPTDKPLIYAARTRFRGRSSFVMTDSNNPLYLLNHDLWEFHLMGVSDLISVFSSGDCGFPLMAMCDNEWKIIGIHNSINGISSTGFFSSISIEDISNVANSFTNTVPHFYDQETGYAIDESTYKALVYGKWDDSKYAGVSALKIIGRNSALHTHSSPKHKKKYIGVCEDILTCETLPSAIDMTHVKDTSKLVADKRGEFYPLFAQSVKYTKRTSTYGNYNTEIFDHVQESIKQYYNMHYGDPTELRIREIINGFEHVKGFDMTTSAGPKMKREFGINVKVPKTGQRNILFINLNESDPQKKPYYVINTKTNPGNALMQDFHHYKGAIESGDPILLIIKDNAKVELLPREKVEEGKVREFNEMDLSVNAVLKSYFGGFLNSVIAKHHECIYTIGFNPYKEATLHMLDFNMIDGEVVSSDFSGLDKSFPKELIFGFVEAVSRGKWSKQTETALSKTLTYTYHSINGHIYPVDCGNESGSYVTTMLNCYAVHFANWYTFTRKWKETYSIMPSLKDFEDNFCQKILGDDCIRKISHRVKISFDDLAEDAALFNLTLTKPKIDGEISFCSRVYKEIRPNIYAPCLKTASITSCLFYLASETKEQISMNINIALFEASLHGKEYFELVAKGAIAVANHYNIQIDLYPHKCYIDYFIGYVLDESKHPTLQAAGSLLTQSIEANAQDYSPQSLIQERKFNKMADMWLNEYIQSQRLSTPVYTFSMDEKKDWHAEILLKHHKNQYKATGEGRTKQHAKRAACEQLKATLNSSSHNIGSIKIGSVQKELTATDIEVLTKAFKDHFNIKDESFSIEMGTTNQANADMPVEPATMNQASRYQGEGSLPGNANPQPTAVVPAMTSSGEDIQAAIMGQEQHTLNPIGAPDMSTVGAIQFDLKDLAYQQYLDADTEIEVSADMSAGTIVSQIPYGWNHPFLNRYAKRWVRQHERYTGSIRYRYTVIGNPLFSGAIGIAWAKKRLTTSIVPVSMMQKYSYSAKGVTMPWNVVHTLHDARKNSFYREVEDDLNDSDLANRPHLVLFLLMSLQNPLQPGVITRIRIASKLATVGEGNPFRALDPSDDELTPETTTAPIPQNRFQSVFPQDLNTRIWLYTDGQLSASTAPIQERYYPDMSFEARKNGIIGGQQGDSTIDFKATYYNVENWAKTDTVDELAKTWPWMRGKSVATSDHVTVYISTVTNMDQLSFYSWIDNNNWPGFKRLPLQPAMTWDRWNANKGFLPNPLVAGGIITHSSTYNTTELTFANNRDSAGNGFSNTIKEWIKYVTDRGTIWFLLCYTQQLRGIATPAYPRQTASRFAGHYQTQTVDNLPLYPIFNVDEQLGTIRSNINTLPSGNLLFRMTEMSPSSVAVGQAQMPTCNDNAVIAKFFELVAQGITTLECIQFRLLDAQSVRPIATVRYLQESRIFVINAPNSPTRYRVIPQNNQNIIISQISVVQRATDFQETVTFDWIDRVAPEFLRRGDLFQTPISPDLFSDVTPTQSGFTANAALLASMAGGGMAGIGQAIGQHQERKHQQQMQSNQFGHEENMQGNMFNFQNQFQQQGFDFQKLMQENQFGFQNQFQGQQHSQEQLLQERGYQNEIGLLQTSHQEQRVTNQQQSQNRMMERGLSSRVMGMPGAVASASRA
jgi:hypothetical protein